MNKFLAGLLIIIMHYALSIFLPWWTIVFLSFIIVALFKLEGKSSWLIPSMSIMLSWLIQILILDQKTNFRSSQRIADLFDAPGFVSYIVPIITVGLVAGLSGYLAHLFFSKNEEVGIVEEEERMTIDEYKDNTPGLEDRGII